VAEKERKRPFAVEQADRDVAAAKQELDRAKESGSQTAIDEAQAAYDEAVATREGLRGKTREERREARQQFMQDYYNEYGPYIAQLVKEDPELRQLLQDAISNGWDAREFDDALRETDWWRDTGKTNAWMQAFQLEFGDAPGGEWEKQLDTSAERVLDFAARYGLTLDEGVVERIARRAIYEGWDDRDLQEWLAERARQGIRGDTYEAGGTVETKAASLKRLASDFGLKYSDEWFTRRAINIMDPSQRFTEEDFINQMVAEAEQLYPVFQGRLSADYTLRDAAGSYIGQMANLLELPDPSQIDLTDPLLGKAFNSVMDNGTPQLMSLWDFTKEVRKDDRWQYTNNAYQTYTNIGTGLARMMGFSG
jgi:hypothetical protein